MKREDLIGIVEAAYDPSGDDEAWLRRVLTCARPTLDGGLGIVAALIEKDAEGRTRIGAMIGENVDDASFAYHRSLHDGMPAPELARLYGTARHVTLSQVIGADAVPHHPLGRWFDMQGGKDGAALIAVDGAGGGCYVGSAIADISSIKPNRQRQLLQLGAHLAAGVRLRRALTGVDPIEAAEAILTPDGKVQHADVDAQPRSQRAALRDMAVAVDRARANLRTRAPAVALDLWKGLTSARWSLIDHYERDGRRYMLAIRNDAQLASLRGLSERERQVVALIARGRSSKLAAYELGLSEALVSLTLRSAMLKLGTRTRAELVRLLMQTPLTTAV